MLLEKALERKELMRDTLDRIKTINAEQHLTAAKLRVQLLDRPGHDGVRLVAGATEEFDLCLGELALPDEPRARCDLVAEGLAHLGDAEGDLAGVLLEAELEVEEDALRRLRPQVAVLPAHRADRRREHQVELDGLGELRLRLGRLDLVLLEDGPQLVLRVRVGLVLHLLVLGLLLLRRLRVRHLRVHHLLEQLVRPPEAVRVLRVLDDEVVEALDVARRREHVVRHDARVVDLEQILLDHEVLPPEVDEVLLHRRARRPVREEAADAAVDLEGLAEEEAALDEVVEVGLLALEFGGARARGDRHRGVGATTMRAPWQRTT